MTILKKSIYLYFILQNSFILLGQKKELLILDKTTNKPIEAVSINYSKINEGTFTNSDGKASINVKDFDLKITHINYDEIIISPDNLKSVTEILLNPKSVQLDEVIINSFNLKKI